MRSLFEIALLMMIASSLVGQDLTPDQVQLQHALLSQPPGGIVKLSERLAIHRRPNAIDVPLILNADLDGSGAFSYFIGFFTIKDTPSGFLRVFKKQGSVLIVAGDQDTDSVVGGWVVQMELVEVKGAGI